MARLKRGGTGRKLARRPGAKYGPPMLKLLRLAVLVGFVAGVLFLLPIGDRTLFERWRAARGPSDFAARTWAELRGSEPPASPGPLAAPRKGKAGKPGGAPAAQPAPDQPLETTTDTERKALDKLLDQHLSEKPKR